MVRYAAEHGITEPEMLKNFDYEGYSFNEAASNEAEWVSCVKNNLNKNRILDIFSKIPLGKGRKFH